MYAVIRAGGKQYRVAPGDVIKIEKLPQTSGENIQFDEVLAVSGSEGELGKPSKAFVWNTWSWKAVSGNGYSHLIMSYM